MSSKKTKRRTLNSLFNNDKFLLALSMIISFFMWTAVSAGSGESVTYRVSGIFPTMELSDDAETDNLSVVSIDGVPLDEFTASVSVKGNSVTVGSLTPSDIQVYGSNLGNIVTSGTYNVSLMARQLGIKNNYDITSVEPSEVVVVVDRTISKELQIDTSKINATSGEEYYMGSPSLSQKTVVVTGPEQSVSKVDKAIVSAELEGELVETTVLEKLSVQLVDAQGNEITDDSLVVDPVTVDVTIPVLMKKTVPLKLDYSHAPSEFSADGFITIEPSELEIAAAADVIDSVEYISIGTLDFNSLSYGASAMSFELVMPEGVKNFNSIEKANVKFDFTNYSTKSFVVNDFDFINTPSGFAAEYSTYRNIVVRVVGPQTSISNLKASEVSTVIDLSDAKSGTTDMPVQVYINKATDCWVFGTYTMNVTVKEASEVSSTLTSAVSSAAESGVKSTDNDQ